MKLYAIEVTEETLPLIEELSNVNPDRLERFGSAHERVFLIAIKPAGIYEMLCYIEGDAFFDEFTLSEDLYPSVFQEVTEL